MKIGLLTTSFPRTHDDVAGIFVLGYARALVDRGHEVCVLAPEPGAPCTRASWPGIEVRHVPYVRPRSLERTFYGAGAPENLASDPRAWLGALTFPPAMWAHAARLHRSWDAIVSHWAVPNGVVGAIFAGSRPHVVVLHSSDVHALERMPRGRMLARAIDARATRIHAVSESLRTRWQALVGESTPEKVDVLPMGIDDVAARAKTGRRPRDGNTAIVAMGRLVPIKGFDLAIEAVSRVPGTTLRVLGDGPERARLESRAARDPRVAFGGWVSGDAKVTALAEGDVFVAPSRVLATGRSEGAPTAVLEAMAAGLAVVASNTGGLPDLVVHERTGLLVPPGDVEALARAIARLRDDDALRTRLSDEAQRVAERHRWSELAPRIEAMLRARPAASPRAPERRSGSPARSD